LPVEPALPVALLDADAVAEVMTPVYLDTLLAVDGDEGAFVEEIVSRWPDTLAAHDYPAEAFELIDVARRIGPGVSSYPLLRYYAVLRGPTDTPDDDWLIEIKEVTDPPAPTARGGAEPLDVLTRRFDDNG